MPERSTDLYPLLLLVGLLSSLQACIPHSTDSTEIGVRTAKMALFETKGVQKQLYPPGSTSFFAPIVNDWHTYDVALQNLEMTRATGSGDRQADDSLRFKTIDGNDISVNVTVAWRIDPTRAWYVLQFVGEDNDAVKERLVRPVARTIIRDTLNSLASEQFYDAEARFKKASEAKERLGLVLGPEGVTIEQVLLGEHSFNQNYEQIIRDKKVAEQNASRLRSEAEAAREQVLRDLEVKKGEVQQTVEKAKGDAQRKHIESDGLYYEKEKQAQALVSEAQASAEGLKAKAKALSGSGGSAQVKLKVAKALKGKPIVFLPASSGMDIRSTDMNKLLAGFGLKSLSGTAAAPPAAPATTAAGQ